MVKENLSQTLISRNPGLKSSWIKKIRRLNVQLDDDGCVSVYYRNKVREAELTYIGFVPCVVIRKPSKPERFMCFPLPMMEKKYITREGHEHKKLLIETLMERETARSEPVISPAPYQPRSPFLEALGYES